MFFKLRKSGSFRNQKWYCCETLFGPFILRLQRVINLQSSSFRISFEKHWALCFFSAVLMWICSCVSHHPALLHLQLDHGWMFFWYKAALKSEANGFTLGSPHLPKTLGIIYRCFLANDRQTFMFFLIVASQTLTQEEPFGTFIFKSGECFHCTKHY